MKEREHRFAFIPHLKEVGIPACGRKMLISVTTHATGLDGDLIYIDGEQWVLLGKPIYADSVLAQDLIAALPKERSYTTANWDGYTAYWSIQEDKLCLDSICYRLYDNDPIKYRTESLSSEILFRVFKKYSNGKRIVAKWLNEEIRVAKGKRIYYVHTAYERNFENERLISIEHGKVSAMKDFQNYVVDGFSFNKPGCNEGLREKFPLNIEQYPELANVKRIVFFIKKARVDAQGNLVECEVKVIKPEDNPRLATEMAEALKAYHPWQVFYINGEYRAYGIGGYSFIYKLND